MPSHKEYLIERYLSLSLADADALLETPLQKAREFFTDAQIERLKQHLARETLAAKRLMRTFLDNNFTEQEMETVVSWISSDVSKKLMQAAPVMMNELMRSIETMSSTITELIAHPERIDDIVN